MLKRSIAPSEIWYTLSKCMVQMSLEIDKPSNVSGIIDKLSKRTLGLKLKFDGDNIIFENN